MASLAHAMAMETDKLQADIIEADEFPHLARQFAVQAVPKTIINQTVEDTSLYPELPAGELSGEKFDFFQVGF